MDAKELTEYVATIIQASGNIVASWGAHDFAPIVPDEPQYPNGAGLQFEVQGYKFTGTVRIVYNEGADVFHVSFWKDGKRVDENPDVYFDELVPHIDGRVELTDDYAKRVKEEYPQLFDENGNPKPLPNIVVIDIDKENGKT